MGHLPGAPRRIPRCVTQLSRGENVQPHVVGRRPRRFLLGATMRKDRRRAKRATTPPHVGIFYLVGGMLQIDSTPLARAGNFGNLAFHESEHEQYWRQLVKKRVAPDTEYTEFPRGRVSHDRRNGQFTLLADACILRQKSLVSTILARMQLPV